MSNQKGAFSVRSYNISRKCANLLCVWNPPPPKVRAFIAHSRVAIDAFTRGRMAGHIDCIRFAVDQLHIWGGACQPGNKDSIKRVVTQC